MTTTIKAVKSAFEKISTDRLAKILSSELPEKPKNLAGVVEKLRTANAMTAKAIEAFAEKVSGFGGDDAPATEKAAKAAKPGKKTVAVAKEAEKVVGKKRGRPKKSEAVEEVAEEKPAKKAKKVKAEKVAEEKPSKKTKKVKTEKTEKVKEEKPSKKKKKTK